MLPSLRGGMPCYSFPKFLPTVIIIFLLLPPRVIVLELTLFSLGIGATGGIGGGRREIVVAAESTSFH
jgi:hypothetical protein